jgi:hypothetical protein
MSNVDREPGERVYDSDFLKLLAKPALQAPSMPAPGRRKVTLPAPERLPQGKAGSYEITLDTSHQVLSSRIPEERAFGGSAGQVEATLYPSFSELNLDASAFAPATALALKAKQFDDGLYACVELAADQGQGSFPARTELLLSLLKALQGESDRTAAALLTAAARLGGMRPQVRANVASQADALQKAFLADELHSKVLGFYTWSEKLSQIFQRDRMLQTPLDEPAARAFAVQLSKDKQLLKAYSSSLSLAEKLTNPFAGRDLRQAAVALAEGHAPVLSKDMSLFPPSRAPETDLIKKLYGDKPIPEGFNLADEMVKRLRAGTLDLKPKPDSGWYDQQSYALEGLAVPERMPEAQQLHFDESYRKELVGLLKALLALTRETHIKQLEIPRAGAAAIRAPLRPRLDVKPDLTVEPLATYYLRRARSYRFVRNVLEQAFGQKSLNEMRRLTVAGPVNVSLRAELRLMEALFHGAYLRSSEEIGMTPEQDSDLGEPQGANANRTVLAAWLARLGKDPDLGKDIRMMVPVFYDVGRKKTKVWAVLGVAEKPIEVSYATEPTIVEIKGPDGKRVDQKDVDVQFVGEGHKIAYIATAEVFVTRLLNRAEFRRLCDQYKTSKAIVNSLQ